MRGHVRDAEVVVAEHHGVAGGVRVVGVDLSVAVEVHVARGEGEVEGLLVEGVGNRGVDLTGERELDGRPHALEGSPAGFWGDAAQLERGDVRHEREVEHVDDTGDKACAGYLGDGVDPDLRVAHVASRTAYHSRVAHDDGPAPVVERHVGEGLDAELRAVPGRVAHRDRDDGAFFSAHGCSSPERAARPSGTRKRFSTLQT